eukprot:gene216-4462_t
MGNKFDSSGDLVKESENPKRKKTNFKNSPPVKCLLAGTGFSGKSTLYFQVNCLINGVQGEKKLKPQYVSGIYHNILLTTSELGKYIIEQKGENSFKDSETVSNLKKIDELRELSGDDPLNVEKYINFMEENPKKKDNPYTDPPCEIRQCFVKIWEDETMREYFKQKEGFDYFDGIEHFLEIDNLKRVASKPYEPSREDILHCRRKTVGVATEQFQVDGIKLDLKDVGGQRNERKKWQKVLSSVDILIYIVSLSDYDEVLYENRDTNKMKEAVEVFEATVNLDWFKNSPIILIFNKKDLLEKKIQENDTLKDVFPEYKGGKNPKAAEEFIQTMFFDLYKGNPDNIHQFTTSVLIPDSAKEAFESLITEAKNLVETGNIKDISNKKK